MIVSARFSLDHKPVFTFLLVYEKGGCTVQSGPTVLRPCLSLTYFERHYVSRVSPLCYHAVLNGHLFRDSALTSQVLILLQLASCDQKPTIGPVLDDRDLRSPVWAVC